MKSSFVSKILNVFFLTLAIDVLFFALFRHYFSATKAMIFAAMASIFVVTMLIAFFSHRSKRFGLKAKELEHMQKCTRALFFASDKCVLEFFYLAISKICPSATKNGEWIETNKQQILPMFSAKQTSAKALSFKLRNAPDSKKEKVVFAISYDDDCSSLDAKLLDAPQIYSLLKKCNTFPKVTETQSTRAKRFTFFDRKKIVRYLSLAILFYFSGRFFGYKALYFACAILCLFLAFFSLFAAKPKEKFVLE